MPNMTLPGMPTPSRPPGNRPPTLTATAPDGFPGTLRDYFAGLALSGMLAADGNDPRWTGRDTGPECHRGGGKWLDPAGVSEQAYEIADAMLAARELIAERDKIKAEAERLRAAIERIDRACRAGDGYGEAMAAVDAARALLTPH